MSEITNIDRQKCRRVVPMRLLVLGCPRTGTDSMRKALVQLGYTDTYHGYSATFENPKDFVMWKEALDAKLKGKGKLYGKAEFDRLLGHCQAVTDVPCICFAEELIEAYPEAKVILTHRDIKEWHKSMMQSVIIPFYNPFNQFILTLMRITGSPAGLSQNVWHTVFQNFFRDFDKNGDQVYREHYDLVRSLVPPDRLLDFRVKEGWEPLCKFLDQPVPVDVGFPFGNTTAETQEKIKKFAGREAKLLGVKFAVLVGVVAVGWGVWGMTW